MSNPIQEYKYHNAEDTYSHSYISSHIIELIDQLSPKLVVDLGCGNGSLTGKLAQKYQAIGIDQSESGIRLAREQHPGVSFLVRSVYDDLTGDIKNCDAIVSTEVIEHLYAPRAFLRNANNILKTNGTIILSTPYHGYLKNIALAVSGKLDSHFTALWDGGHIKFWSVRTISQVLNETGFEVEAVRRVGRVPVLAKSMIIVAKKRTAIMAQSSP